MLHLRSLPGLTRHFFRDVTMVSTCCILLLLLVTKFDFISAFCPSRQVNTGDRYFVLPERYKFRGEIRGYSAHIPAHYRPALPTPVVLFLHGNGGSSSRAAENTRFLPKSDQEGFILVFPEGIQNKDIVSNMRVNAGHSWNAGTCCSTAVEENVDDISYFEAVLSDLKNK